MYQDDDGKTHMYSSYPNHGITLDTGGNVGIGNSSPTVKLDVAGTVKATSFQGEGGHFTGNVGIGTANTSGETLEVLGGIMSQGPTAGSSRLVLKSTAVGGQQYEWYNDAVGAGSGVLALFNRTQGNAPIAFTPSGNVGIGTTSPSTSLEVVGNHASAPVAVFRQSNPANLGSVAIDSPTDNGSRPSHLLFRRGGVDRWSVGGFYPSEFFGIGTSQLLADQKLVVDTDGNVGIGITSPTVKLDVAGTVKATSFQGEGGHFTGNVGIGTIAPVESLHLDKPGDNFMRWSEAGPQRAVIGVDGGANRYLNGVADNDFLLMAGGNINIKASTLSSGGPHLYLSTSGSVGIGTTSPNLGSDRRALTVSAGTSGEGIARLEVQGTRIGDNIYGALDFYHKANNTASIESYRSGADDAGNLAFRTKASGMTSAERMRIDHLGNVGIGTTTPSVKFHVIGDQAYIQGTANLAALDVNQGGTGPAALFRGGNVGIGTTSPQALMDVVGTDPLSGLVLKLSTTDPSPPDAAFVHVVRSDSLQNPTPQRALMFLKDHANNYPLEIENQAGDPLFTVKGNGNVGIGTVSPVTRLHVDGGSSDAILRLENRAAGRAAAVQFKDTSGSTVQHVVGQETSVAGGLLTGDTPHALVVAAGGANPIEFGVNDQVVMAMVNGGNVGIGTRSPTAKLEVVGTVKATSFIGDGSGLTGVGAIGPAGGDLTGSYPNPTIANSAVTSAKLASDAGSLNKVSGGAMTSSSGNVGIGTASPTAKLDVVGTVKALAFMGDGSGLANVSAVNTWRLTGNAGTTPGTHFLGTTDNQAIQIRVNNAPALRLQPSAGTPNIVGGSYANFAPSTVQGVVIAGGGDSWDANSAEASFCFIGSGLGNSIATSSTYSTIAGGYLNDIGTNSDYSAIGGGTGNNIAANSTAATIAGGASNTIQTNSHHSTIGGGNGNTINNFGSTIGGGIGNMINNFESTIGGGIGNTIQTNAYDSTIGGGSFNTIYINAPASTIGGGRSNAIQDDAENSTIGGGSYNTIQDDADLSTIGGGVGNTIYISAYNTNYVNRVV